MEGTPASLLTGRQLARDWRVVERLTQPAGHTAGYFSIGYVVENTDGRRGFLKALDYSKAFESGADRPRILEAVTAAYNYERDLLSLCRAQGLSRVVQLLDEGSVHVPGGQPIPDVDYLILELADCDARSRLKELDVAWAMRTLHQMAAALSQLHGANVAHQDIKPSNVLIFGPSRSKLADLGRASRHGFEAIHDFLPNPGDRRYAALELVYGHVSNDWRRRRVGADLYQLGNLAACFFCGAAMSHLVVGGLSAQQQPNVWGGSYDELMPYLRHSTSKALAVLQQDASRVVSDEHVVEKLVELVTQLCDPDPAFRGHPKNRLGTHDRYGIERFVSGFDLLATRLEYTATRSPR